MVREVPALLGDISVKDLLQDLADEVKDLGSPLSLKERLAHVLATCACTAAFGQGASFRLKKSMRFCVKWSKPPIRANAIMDAPPMWSSNVLIWKNFLGGGDELVILKQIQDDNGSLARQVDRYLMSNSSSRLYCC